MSIPHIVFIVVALIVVVCILNYVSAEWSKNDKRIVKLEADYHQRKKEIEKLSEDRVQTVKDMLDSVRSDKDREIEILKKNLADADSAVAFANAEAEESRHLYEELLAWKQDDILFPEVQRLKNMTYSWMTQREIAELVGVSAWAIWKWIKWGTISEKSRWMVRNALTRLDSR